MLQFMQPPVADGWRDRKSLAGWRKPVVPARAKRTPSPAEKDWETPPKVSTQRNSALMGRPLADPGMGGGGPCSPGPSSFPPLSFRHVGSLPLSVEAGMVQDFLFATALVALVALAGWIWAGPLAVLDGLLSGPQSRCPWLQVTAELAWRARRAARQRQRRACAARWTDRAEEVGAVIALVGRTGILALYARKRCAPPSSP